MARLGSGILSVTLVANTGKFRRDMRNSKSSIKSFTGSVGLTKRALGGLATAFLGFRGVSGLVNKFVETFTRLEDVTRTAQRLGLSVEQLQVFQEAARRTNIPLNQFNVGLQRLIRRIGQASSGTGEAVDALFELGVGARRLVKQNDTAKAFEEIIEKLSGMENSFARVRLAQKLFDSEGVKLLDLLGFTGDGFANLRKQMIASGQILSAQMTDKILDANNAFKELQASSRAFFDQLAVKAAPVVSKTATAINQLSQAMSISAAATPAAIGGAIGALERVTSGFGLAPNPVSGFLGESAAEFERNSLLHLNNELMRQQIEATKQINTGAQ